MFFMVRAVWNLLRDMFKCYPTANVTQLVVIMQCYGIERIIHIKRMLASQKAMQSSTYMASYLCMIMKIKFIKAVILLFMPLFCSVQGNVAMYSAVCGSINKAVSFMLLILEYYYDNF